MKNKFDLQKFAMTLAADVIAPELFAAYMTQEIIERSPLLKSGIAVASPIVDKLASENGLSFQIPYFGPLDGEDTVIDDTAVLTVDQFNTGDQVGIRLIRQKSWGRSDLAVIFAGKDPIKETIGMVGEYWALREQKVALSILKALFGAGGALAATHVLNKSTEVLTSDIILDAKQKLGDAAENLSILAIHSATKTLLQKQNLIETIVDSEGKILFEKYLGYQLEVFDDMPVEAGVYTSYLLGKGCFVRGDGVPTGLIPYETDRDSLGASNIMITRRSFVLHPQGMSWAGAINKVTPTNAQLEVAASWTKKFEDKRIHMVAITHKVA